MSNFSLTPVLLTWRIWWAPNNASKWKMGFNLTFKGLSVATFPNFSPKILSTFLLNFHGYLYENLIPILNK